MNKLCDFIFPFFYKVENFRIINFGVVQFVVFCILYFYFARYFLQIGSLINIYIPQGIINFFYYLLLVTSIYRLLNIFAARQYYVFLICVVCIYCFYQVWKVSYFQKYIFEFILLTICCYRFSYKTILIAFLTSVGLIIVSEVLLMLWLSVPDLIYQGLRGDRHTFGGAYPTNFAASLFFTVLALWCIARNNFTSFFICLVSILLIIQFCYTKTRNSEILMILLLLII